MADQAADEVIRNFDDRPPSEIAHALDEFDDEHGDPGDPELQSEAAPAAPAQWRVAKALLKLRTQINEAFPNRSKASDGTIGDTNHCPGTSDHCPQINDGGVGVVTAMDITNDPAHGLISHDIADKLRLSHDPRIKYIISNRKIANHKALDGHPPFAWRTYNGANPHNKHFHISVKATKTGPDGYDTEDGWAI